MSTRPPNRFIEGTGRAFGRPGAVWRPESDSQAHEVSAAYLQHRVVLRAEDQLHARGLTIDDFAELLDQNAETLRKKLRGETRTQIADLLAWAMVLGLDVLEPWPDEPARFLPQPVSRLAEGWQPGRLVLPSLGPADPQALPWRALVDHVLADLVADGALGGLHTIDGAVVRHHLVRRLAETGIAPHRLWIDEQVGGQRIDVVVDAPPEVCVTTSFTPSSTDLRVTERALHELVVSLVRLRHARGQRCLLAVAAAGTIIDRLATSFSGAQLPAEDDRFVIPGGALRRLLPEDASDEVVLLEIQGTMGPAVEHTGLRAVVLFPEKFRST